MKKIFYGIFILIAIGLISVIVIMYKISSGLSGGTHGSIKSYYFNASKFKLENSIDSIFKASSNISRDSSIKDYYNKDGYVEMTIRRNNKIIKYNFRYYGDSLMWKNNPNNSSIFICYLYDSKGKAISQGNDNVKGNEELIEEQISIFEEEFVRRINESLKEEKKIIN